jgi:hypothetical protein
LCLSASEFSVGAETVTCCVKSLLDSCIVCVIESQYARGAKQAKQMSRRSTTDM